MVKVFRSSRSPRPFWLQKVAKPKSERLQKEWLSPPVIVSGALREFVKVDF